MFFHGKSATIEQGEKKIDGNDASEIQVVFNPLADVEGAGIKFVGHLYQPLQYYIESFNDTAFTLYAYRGNFKVYSTFKKK